MSTSTIVILTLIAVIVGGGAFVVWMLVSDANERRKHYKVTLTVKPNNTIGVYYSKMEPIGRHPITVVPGDDTPFVDLDVHLSDGKVEVTDIRPLTLEWMGNRKATK